MRINVQVTSQNMEVHGLKDCVGANSVQDLAKEPMVNCVDKTFRLAPGIRVTCLSQLHRVTDRNVGALRTCCVRDFALSGHCQGQTVDPVGVRGVIVLNKIDLNRN